jgi:tetratricopeptide (TPR) repeat protein
VRSDLDALRSARFLSADKTPLMNEGLLLYATGRRAEGIAAERRLVAQEPDNLDAWLALVYMYSTSRDTKEAARALRRVRTLNPLAQERLTDVRP